MSSGIRVLALLVLVGVMTGCQKGPELSRVRGKVTLDGNPLPMATVEFIPDNGRPGQAQTNAAGEYEILHTRNRQGALAGRHKVRISTWRQPEVDAQDRVTHHPETLPARYNYESELTFDVQPGRDNIANFDLKSGGKIVQPPK
ncbi:carboxypeptidase-like regulatory domain-containing protein [Planctomicrobium sp. SH664]|uniref:carboxypeptidase-like regulatory domain-containing protein n=1 Tax=Planctomicrobium sp. SH664 TaxID=3448125 RepID=UPI003F5BA949